MQEIDERLNLYSDTHLLKLPRTEKGSEGADSALDSGCACTRQTAHTAVADIGGVKYSQLITEGIARNQPEESWTDDTSMQIAIEASLKQSNEVSKIEVIDLCDSSDNEEPEEPPPKRHHAHEQHHAPH